MAKVKNEFLQGYICACSNLFDLFRDDVVTSDVLKEVFVSLKDLRDGGVDEYDIKKLMPVIKILERKNKP